MSGMSDDWCMPAGVIAPERVKKTQWSSSALLRMSSYAVRS